MHSPADSIIPDVNASREHQPFTVEQSIGYTTQYLFNLGRHMPGFKPREAQTLLAKKISEVAHNTGLLVAQAGTGTGKTYAYLLGALPQVIYAKKRLIISTHTISLQTQLVEKDLPHAIQNINSSLIVKIAKGSSRYFCPKRALEFLAKEGESAQGELDIEQSHCGANAALVAQVNALFEQYSENKFDGDLDTIENPSVQSVEHLVCRQYDRCAGQQTCEFGKECPFYLARAGINQANIVITNHALLSHTLINETNCLGELNDQILIIDEAHQFLPIYRNESQHSLEFCADSKLVDKLTQLTDSLIKVIKIDGINRFPVDTKDIDQHTQSLKPYLKETESLLAELYAFLTANYKALRGPLKDSFDNLDQWLLGFEQSHPDLSWLLLQLYTTLSHAESRFQLMLNKLISPVEKSYADHSTKAQKHIGALSVLSHELDEYLEQSKTCLERFVRHDQLYTTEDRVRAGLVRWIKRNEKEKGFRAYSNLVNLTESLEKKIYNRLGSVIFTSATIEALNSPKQFISSLGLEHQVGLSMFNAMSPFDYSKVNLLAPIKQGDVNHPSYSIKIKQQLEQSVLRHKSILMLFSSYQQLNQVYDLCSPRLRSTILRQADFSASQIITKHKQRIDNGETSILFGVDSLSEGIDLQRHYLTCVMIAKFPFPNINEPLLAYEARSLEYYGKSSFNELSLPICSRKLIQSVGRLIRSEDDYGEVILLDSRVHSKSYAKRLIYSLPFYS
jgi:ATP-dependent DNA helicase DinG